MVDLTVKDFEKINNFSNNNVERVVAEIVNESSNAALISTFDDSVILLDHEDGQFYSADYTLDAEELTLIFDNFSPINIYKEEDDLQEKALDYFDEDSDVSVEDVVNSFKNTFVTQNSYIKEVSQNALMGKDLTEVINWRELKAILEDAQLNNIKSEPFYREYKKRIETHPLTEVKYFDWENPVTVSIVEKEDGIIFNGTAVDNANSLWKDPEFREEFISNCEILVDDVKDGMESLAEFFQKYPQVYFLESTDRQTMFGKAILYSDELRDDSEDILKGLNEAFERFDIAEIKEQYLEEAEDMMNSKSDSTETKDSPPDVPKDGQKKAAAALKKVAVDVEDPALKKKLEKIISDLEGKMNEGTDPILMKEIVSILEV